VLGDQTVGHQVRDETQRVALAQFSGQAAEFSADRCVESEDASAEGGEPGRLDRRAGVDPPPDCLLQQAGRPVGEENGDEATFAELGPVTGAGRCCLAGRRQ
jgi:hypothetical protein